jgi:hypothetical protein
MTRPRRFLQPELPRAGSRLQLIGLLLALAIVLVACGAEEADNRRFANDPVTERAATATPAPTEPGEPTATALPLASPETLLNTRGAPDTLYTVANDDLVALTIGPDGPVEQAIDLPDDRPLLGYDASPNGDRVAVLVGPNNEQGSGISLLFFDRAGELVGNAGAVLEAVDSATPVAGAQQERHTVAWSPQGDAVLVTGARSLVNVPLSAAPESLSLDGVGGTIQRAVWSPQGAQIAIHVAHDNGSQEVLLVSREGDITEVPALNVEAGSGIEQLEWLPDGSGLIYLRVQLRGDVPLAGQIFTYGLSDQAPTLVATSGQGGPSATITTFAASSDGRSVAYVIAIRDADAWSFHSLWVRSFKQPLSYQAPVGSVAGVTRLWWVDRGLAWDQTLTEDGSSPSEIVFVSMENEPAVLLVKTPEASGATPAATPAASPGATPEA